MAKRYVTPKGIAHYPHLVVPNTKWKEQGEYSTGLILEKDDANELIQIINKVLDEAFVEAQKKTKKKLTKYYPYQPYDEETGGNKILFRFKSTASYIDKTTNQLVSKRIPLFGADGHPIAPKSIYSGSVIRVNFSMKDYSNPALNTIGVSLYINAVQILKLVTSNNDGTVFGFEAEKDRLKVEESSRLDEASNVADSSSEDDDDIPF